MMRADPPFALYQSDNSFLRRRISIGAVPGSTADESFVHLDKFALAAERSSVVNAEICHRFAETMRQKPCGLQCDAEDAVQLVSAYALLAGAMQMHCLEPNMQLDVAGLEDGTDLDRERFAAGIAFVDADAGALALQWPALVYSAAVGAWPAIGPQSRLDKPIGGFFTMEMCGGKDGWHGVSP
jgi:hypothetical protein